MASNGLTRMGSCFYSNDSTTGRTTSLLGWAASSGVVPGAQDGAACTRLGEEGDGAPGRRVMKWGAQLYL